LAFGIVGFPGLQAIVRLSAKTASTSVHSAKPSATAVAWTTAGTFKVTSPMHNFFADQ
jgi:hypothetical protein